MRNGIEEQLPKSFPRDKVVLVVGPEDGHGFNALKSKIDQLNRAGDWIRTEFRTSLAESRVTEKVAVILTMNNTKEGPLVNARKAARRLGIHCPHHALTIGEVKNVLDMLAERREKPSQPPANGDGHLKLEAAVETVRPVNDVDTATAPIEREAGARLSDENPKSPLSETKELLVMELGELIETLNNARNSIESLDIGAEEEIARLRSQLDTLHANFQGKDREITDLRSELDGKSQEIDRLTEELSRARLTARENATLVGDLQRQCRDLEAEKNRLQAALEKFEGIMREVRKG